MTENKIGMRDEALSFLVNHDEGVLATASQNKQPSARFVYYTCDDSFNIYFITLSNTRKVGQLESNPYAAFVVADTKIPRTIQVEGEVQDLSFTVTNDALLTNFVHRLMEQKRYGIPLAHFDPGELKFYKLTPTWIRWGNFTFGQGTDTVLTQIDPSSN